MAASFSKLKARVNDLHWNLSSTGGDRKPIVVLLHGLGGDCNDWMDPFQDRNFPYDHEADPEDRDMGVHTRPPVAQLPGLPMNLFMSPQLKSNSKGIDRSDDRSWWHALVKAGFPVFTYSQVPDLMVPLNRGPVEQFTRFMETLQRDVLSEPPYTARQVVMVGHSRGGLIGRAFLGHPDFRSGRVGVFPRVRGLITISSPHQGSHMALMDDKIIGFLEALQRVAPALPNDVGNEVISKLKKMADDYVGAHGDEIEPDSPLFKAMEAQEPVRSSVRCISVGGTSPRLLRLYLWTYTAGSMLPKRASEGSGHEFHWKARAKEVKGASPIPDGLPLKLLGMDLDEILPGRGDGLTANKRCRFPPSFRAEEHISVPLSHAEELWDPSLQQTIIEKLETFE